MRLKVRSVLAIGAASLLLNANSAQAGSVTYNFDQDPAGVLEIVGNNATPWQPAGGNPASGGFLAVTYSEGSQYTGFLFPDLDSGKIVTAFKFECDLRVGNSSGDRAADGFSISFARSTDPLIEGLATTSNFAGGIPEGGATSGIAISFDTWSGNTLPDGADIEGIIVRVDNKTVLRQSLPTRHGAPTDATSLQTGPRDLDFWASGGDVHTPDAWKTLTWQPFSLEIDDAAKLTVKWKNTVVLDKFQTAYFPSAGRLVFAGRTGGANEQTHVDNIKLTTTAVTVDTEKPTIPTGFKSATTGAQRVVLTWTAATDNSGRVGYEIEQDGTLLTTTYTATTAELRGLTGGTSYSFKVRATDVSGNKSDWSAALAVKTAALVQDNVFASLKIFGTTASTIGGTAVDALAGDPRYPDAPDRIVAISGMTFGEPNFGDTFGDNNGFRIAGTITVPETGQYNFFVRSDDASELYLNTKGAAIPVYGVDTPIAAETGCCEAFKEQTSPATDQPFETTTTPIQLTAGQKYGILFLVKEGGGGDWGQVAMRKVGDTTPAANLPPIRFPIFETETKPMVDAVGATAKILQNPVNVTAAANEKVTFMAPVQTASPYNSPVFSQWYKNGVAIPGANSSVYTIPAVSAADNGAKFKMLIAVLGASTTSTEATLTVTADTQAPSIVSVKGDGSLAKMVVVFSEAVKAPAASNFTLSDGVTVSAAQALNSTTVALTTSKQAEGATYTLTVNGVQDEAGNAMANVTAKFRAFSFLTGKVLYEVWSGIGGTAVADLTANANYPNNPDIVQTLNAFSSPVDRADNFGARLSGYFLPKTAGNYVFFVNADDGAALYLSTDDNPANKKLIATESGWSGTLNWLGVGGGTTVEEKRSDQYASTEWPSANTITLQAGKRYYMELIYKEGGGGDEGEATFKLASAADPASGTPSALKGEFVGTFAGPVAPFRDYGIGLNFGSDALTAVDCELSAAEVAGAPSVLQANWNNLKGANGTNVANIVADNAGTSEATSVTVDWISNNLWTSTGQGEENNQFTGADRVLMAGYLDTGNATTTTVKVSNIPAALTNNGYDVYVYGLGGVSGRGGAYRIVDASGAVLKDYAYGASMLNPGNYVQLPAGTVKGTPGVGNYIVFNGLKAASITIEATTAGGLGYSGTPRAPINAVQLVAPASAAPVGPVTAPKLSMALSAGKVVITYEGALESADTLAGPWTAVTGASPLSVTPTGAQKFYRAKK